MQSSTGNPLAKHFRQPAIYLKLPSNGKYWPEGSIEMPVSGELPIYPMTTRDEIVLRTPDALLNGEGIVAVIQSCCPAIKDAWQLPNIDLDPILVAIRIASYGSDMEVTSKCPHCNNENSNTVNLNMILDRYKMPNFENTLEIEGLTFKLKPQAYLNTNKNNMIMFEEQKILQSITDDSVPEEVRTARFEVHMSKLVDLNLEILTASCEYIRTNQGETVTDYNYILEFFKNASTKIVKSIRARLEELAVEAALPKMLINCEAVECEKEYEMALEFNYSSFFAQSS